MNNNYIYPWQDTVWRRLSSLHSDTDSRLPHALLLYGKNGIGKLDFAVALAQSLLCESASIDGHACGTCASCGYFLQNNHPDYRFLTPQQDMPDEEGEMPATSGKTGKKSQIVVDQIRGLADFLGLTSHRGQGLKVVLIHPAEALNTASANALLKMLEEPPPGVVFILVSHQLHRLLPTITSRCQKIEMPVPSQAIASAWLERMCVKDATRWLDYAGGAPLMALSEAQEGGKLLDNVCQSLARGSKLDPFLVAPLCLVQGMETSIKILQKWTYDLLNYSLTRQVRYYQHYIMAMQSLAGSVNLSAALEFQHKLNDARRSAAHPLNNELQMESLLQQYTQLFFSKNR